jgi:hypothetical protein
LRTTISELAARGSHAWSRRNELIATAAERVLDWLVWGFALWTLCCHLTVATKGTGVQLWWTAGVVLALCAAAFAYRAWRARSQPSTTATAVAAGERAMELPAARPISVVGLFGAFVVIGVWNKAHDPFWFWADATVFLLLSTVLLLWKPIALEPAPLAQRGAVRKELALWGIALLCALLTAMMRRPNSDDVLYVNIAATLADHPEYVLYGRDTLHGEGMTLMAAYTAHSYELLAGTLARLTHSSALRIMHLGFAPVAGGLTVLALGKLFKLIEPRRWLWLVVIAVSCYLFDGTTDRSITGHAFPRMYQGKAVLLSAGVPLVASYAIGFALRPSWRAWLLLAASVVTGIGLSSTGIWLALLVAFTGLFVPLRFSREYGKALLWGLASLLYPIGFALAMRSAVIDASGGSSTRWQIPTTIGDAGVQAQGLRPELNSFGSPLLAHAYLALLLLAWPLARTALARRYLVAFSLGGFAILMNPFLTGLVAANITGNAAYVRALWYMPFTAGFALSFAAAIPSSPGKLGAALGTAVTVWALFLFYRDYPKHSTLGLLEFPPHLKVDDSAYAAARAITRALHDDQAVALVPSAVALVEPMLQHSPLLVISKPKFFDDEGARYRLMVKVEKQGPALRGRYRKLFIDQLALYKVRGIVTTEAAMQTDGLGGSLDIAQFKLLGTAGGYGIWTRPPWPAAEHSGY